MLILASISIILWCQRGTLICSKLSLVPLPYHLCLYAFALECPLYYQDPGVIDPSLLLTTLVTSGLIVAHSAAGCVAGKGATIV